MFDFFTKILQCNFKLTAAILVDLVTVGSKLLAITRGNSKYHKKNLFESESFLVPNDFIRFWFQMDFGYI